MRVRVATEQCLEALQILVRSSTNAGPDDIPRLMNDAGSVLGARRVRLYLVDYDQIVLVPLSAVGETKASLINVDGTLPGRVYQASTQQAVEDGDDRVIWMPLVNGTERLGVVQFVFPREIVSEDVTPACDDMTRIAAQLITTRTDYGDRIEQTRRRTRLSVAAEMQWRQLPPLTFISGRVTISGALLPTEDIAGDAFDYAMNGEIAHVAVFDAMGHELEATLLSGVAVATLRNARRRGLGLTEIVRTIDAQLGRQFGDEMFVTGIVGELDISNGYWSWVTCGHPPALVVRRGRVVKTLDQSSGVPMGIGMLPPDLEVGKEQLEPGDKVLLYTDGVVEARDEAGEFFGIDRLVDLVGKGAVSERPAPEMLRQLNMALLEHQDGRLEDDATTVMLEWSGAEPPGPPGTRSQ